MTVIQKKTDNPIAHLSPEDIEELGRKLDAIRQEVIESRGAADAAYIRRMIKTQRGLEAGKLEYRHRRAEAAEEFPAAEAMSFLAGRLAGKPAGA